MSEPRERLDLLLVLRGLTPSRERARALIMAGQVLVDGVPVGKAGTRVPEGANVRLLVPEHPFVSRGGVKLEAALEAFALDVAGLSALDVGASTGGFTDCLLRRGARHVVAVDVGRGQLAWSLRSDPRVTCIERTNARDLDGERLRQQVADPSVLPPDLSTVDVSFISLRLVLPAIASILGPGRPIVALVKPQFEAGRADVGKGGVVRDVQARQRAIDGVLSWARNQGFSVEGGLDSPISGPHGNLEYLTLLRPGSTAIRSDRPDDP